MSTDNEYEFDDTEKSKTQLKKEMHALQALGKQLSELNDDQLGRMPLEPKLHEALLEYRRLRHNEARRRQLQFIGRLMREADQEGIQKVMDQFNQQSRANVQLHHSAEQWRDRLLAEPEAVQTFIEEHAVSDIQHFRQLLRQAQKEASQNKPPAASRKLFKEIREILSHEIFPADEGE